MDQFDSLKFSIEFTFKDRKHVAYVTPVAEMTSEQLRANKIKEGSFLIHLFNGDRFVAFEMFIDDEYRWQTNASALLVDKEILELLGAYIDSKYA